MHSPRDLRQVVLVVKNPPATAGDLTQVPFPGRDDPLEEGMATHSSVLAWRIPWTEEPCGLQSMGSQGVGHNLNDLIHTQRDLNRNCQCILCTVLGAFCHLPCVVGQLQLKHSRPELFMGVTPWRVDHLPP